MKLLKQFFTEFKRQKNLALFKLFSTIRRKNYLRSYHLRKLHIGCGPYLLNGWLNCDNLSDYANSTEDKIFLDAARPFPFSDNTFDYIYSEHMIEHLEFNSAEKFLDECFRILKPKGKIRLATPNLDFLVNLYSERKNQTQERYIHWASTSFSSAVPKPKPSFVINNFFYNWGHKFIFDFETLESLLIDCGFSQVKSFEIGKSSDLELSNLEQHGKEIPEDFNRLETMCVEAQKLR